MKTATGPVIFVKLTVLINSPLSPVGTVRLLFIIMTVLNSLLSSIKTAIAQPLFIMVKVLNSPLSPIKANLAPLLSIMSRVLKKAHFFFYQNSSSSVSLHNADGSQLTFLISKQLVPFPF